MKEEDKLVEKFGRKGPWTVPDGYFESVITEINAKLPDYPAAPAPVRLSTWQRMKPYVYLAAMFAGIWCMMQVFHHASGGMQPINIDNPPQQLAALMSDPDVNDQGFLETYLSGESLNDEELIEEVSARYDDFSEFEADFGFELEPEYANMKL